MGTVAVVCSDHSVEDWVFRALDGALVIVDVAPADVMVITEDCLEAIVAHVPPESSVVVLGEPTRTYSRADFVITRSWREHDLQRLLVALANHKPLALPPLGTPENPAEARDAQRALLATRKMSTATDLASTEAMTVENVVELVDADRAYCLYYDAESAALWSESRRGGEPMSAIVGMAAFAARTGHPAVAPKVGEDPRFFGAIDDPQADEGDHTLAQPILGADGLVHAVVVVSRRVNRPFFRDAEVRLLARFAQLAAPVLDQLSIHVHSEALLEEEAAENPVFRRAAIQAASAPTWGDVVRVSPSWITWAYWVLVAVLVAAGVFTFVGRVSTYSAGPAIVRSTARTPIAARNGGIVVALDVSPGDRVAAGAPIARLDDSEQRAAVDHLQRELETQLRAHMLDPGDLAADSALRTIRHDLDGAKTALDERVIHAPVAGVIGDVRARSSQRLEPGDVIATVVDSNEALEVIALLPGEDRPQLAPGMTVRLELAGYRYAYQSFAIENVSQDVIAPAEAKRVLGAEVADGLALPGPVVIVRGKLAKPEFVVDGRTLRYHDGMVGTAEVRVRSEPIVYALVPGTRRFQ
ncbi:MAG: HlyD family efflux transporter periplasmic adaptor subunit [Deltaproteobacteria bacterium]|nr:HlyD family efflux transporter periplasmic adaptor subunit [Deltaproteobacteria bacterium]